MCVRVAPDPHLFFKMNNSPDQKKSNHPWGYLAAGVFLGVALVAFFLFQQGVLPHVPTIEPPEEVDLSVFWETWNRLEENYIRSDEIDRDKMIYGAISGMVDALGDPHTTFFDPQESDKFREDLSGEIEGVGMEIGLRQGTITVISPLKDTPAEKAGILPGDQIIEIDGESSLNIGVDEAVRLIRGPKGSELVLSLRRPDVFDEREFSLTRAVIQIPSVSWEMIGEEIAYLHINHFHEGLRRDFQGAATDILKSSAQGIILDLRNNPGGYLDVAVNVAGWFLPEGDVVVVEEFASGSEKEFLARGNAKLSHYPTVVLINKGTASGSEILAGALRDNRNIRIVGERSFGKGSVQQAFNLRDGSLVKITIAKWFTPDGHLIEEAGLEPDVTVELDIDKYLEEGEDQQLDKAIEILKDIIR